MSEQIENQTENKLLAQKSTADSEKRFPKTTIGKKESNKKVNIPKNLPKEEEIKKIITTNLIIEKEQYPDIKPLTAKKIICFLNNYYYQNKLQEYLRQNEFLIELTNKKIEYDEEITKDIYIKLRNINENEIFINKSLFISLINLNRSQIVRDNVKDIFGEFHTINIYNYLAKIYTNLTNNNIIKNDKKGEEEGEDDAGAEEENILYENYKKNNKEPDTESNYFLGENVSLLTNEQSSVNSRMNFKEPKLYNMKKNVIISDPIELVDKRGDKFKIKKCFLKYLMNRIAKNLPLPKEEKVVDIDSEIRTIEPNNPKIFLILVQNSHIGEVLFNSENRYFAAEDIESKKRFVNSKILNSPIKINYNNNSNSKTAVNDDNNNTNTNTNRNNNELVRLSSISSDDGSKHKCNSHYSKGKNYFKKKVIDSYKQQKNLSSYIKMYDVNNKTVMISERNILIFYQKILNQENTLNKKQIFNENGELTIVNINKIRSKPIIYYTCLADSPNKDLPYLINNEESISYFEVTNCVDGEKFLIKTTKILSLIKSNIGNQYAVLDSKGSIKISIDELKEMIKIENLNYEFIKVKNVTFNECFIRKHLIYSYIKKLMNNSQINPILATKDNEGKQQFFDMKQLFKGLISISPSPFQNDEFLNIPNNTYILSNQGFMNVKNSPLNELFEFVKIEDSNKESFFLRKPFIRNIIYSANLNRESIPNEIELFDLHNKRRKVYLKSYMKNYLKELSKIGNIKTVFLNKDVYVECFINSTAHLLLKSEIENFLSMNKDVKYSSKYENKKLRIKDINDNKIEIDLNTAKKINLKKIWILVKDKNGDYCLLYKTTVKNLIINKLFTKNEIDKPQKIYDVYDYFVEKRKIDSVKILNNFLFQKGSNTKNQIVVEIIDKKV